MFQRSRAVWNTVFILDVLRLLATFKDTKKPFLFDKIKVSHHCLKFAKEKYLKSQKAADIFLWKKNLPLNNVNTLCFFKERRG